MKRGFWSGLWPFVGVAIILWALWISGQQSTQPAQLSFSEFTQLARDGRIGKVTIDERTVRGEFREPVDGKTHFISVRVPSDLFEELSGSGIEVRGAIRSSFWDTLLAWIIPLVLFVSFWAILARGVSDPSGPHRFTAFSQNRARRLTQATPQVTFDDVAGVDEAKAELMEIVDFLKNPDDYGRLGAHIPKGILLVGPPGTGKTLLARAVAGQAGVAFFSITGSEFVELFVGVGAARVRDLFSEARREAPCIIFIDELDAIGRTRGLNQLAPHEEREQTLNQLLAEIDGFDPSSGVVLLAATNRPEILDPALLRAGRFDRQVSVDPPDRKGREAILQVHLRKVHLAPTTSIAQIAGLTTGFSGADLANLVNEAAIIATRHGADWVDMGHFEQALERILAGLERKTRLLTKQEQETVAVHELGHAITSLALPGSDPIQKISIIPRGTGRLGYTIQRPDSDRYIMTKEELERRICVLLGGRAAEQIVFGTTSTGASDDLVKATSIARAMVETYAMDESVGLMSFQGQGTILTPDIHDRRQDISEEIAGKIDVAISAILRDGFICARKILEANRQILDAGARSLLERETFGQDEISDLKRQIVVPEQPTPPRS